LIEADPDWTWTIAADADVLAATIKAPVAHANGHHRLYTLIMNTPLNKAPLKYRTRSNALRSVTRQESWGDT
jgi:hypothetical protein